MTSRPAGIPEWATVGTVEASRWDAGTVYVVVDAHRLDDETPYLFKTTDFGESWTSLTAGLDQETYLHVVREDTLNRGMLYLGTERGVMVSRDNGSSWESLRLNMPTVSVVDLEGRWRRPGGWDPRPFGLDSRRSDASS